MLEPDHDAIRAHLDALFEVAEAHSPDSLIELRYGPPSDLTHWRYFPVDVDGRADAARFAALENEEGRNVYVGVNPRRGPKIPARAGVAADVDVAFFHFADIDRGEAADKLNDRLVNVPPTLAVMTGTQPNNRPHVYWRLDRPETDLDAWSRRQRQIATSLDGDMVIDPPRIMRLGGTINFPTEAKRQRGYVVERTSVRQRWVPERPPVAPDAIIASLPVVPVADRGATGAEVAEFGTGRTGRLIKAALADENWHNNTRSLVARLARLGRTDEEILLMAAGLTRPGFTVADTAEEIRTFLRSARVKFGIAQPHDDEIEAGLGEESEEAPVFPLLSIDELEALPPPTWLVHELIADHGLSIIYGPPGGGKTFIALDMCLRIAHGLDWHGVSTNQTGVLYIAGEGARGIGKRIKGWRREHAMDGVEAPFLALPVPVQMLDADDRRKLLRTIAVAIERTQFQVGLVVIDTVSRSIAGQDENSQEAMTLFVNACNAVQDFTGGAVLGVHHSGKDASRGMRGSTVLLGGCDASIRLTRQDDGRVEIDVEKQKDAEQGDPVLMTLKKVVWGSADGEMTTLVPYRSSEPAATARQLTLTEARAIFEMVSIAWREKNPWSTAPQAKRRGRYLPNVIAQRYGITEDAALGYVIGWQEEGLMQHGIADERRKTAGIEVLKTI